MAANKTQGSRKANYGSSISSSSPGAHKGSYIKPPRARGKSVTQARG